MHREGYRMELTPCQACQSLCETDVFCHNPSCNRNFHHKYSLYTQQLISAEESVKNTVQQVYTTLKNHTGTIYITGIGKSSHIVSKCVATWQSFSLMCHKLLLQDLTHGDFGILRPNDIIIYISNSGNTEELISVAQYVKTKLHVQQICISNNSSAKLNTIVDQSFVVGYFKIQEADTNNCAPTVSPILFMMVLDLVGIYLADSHGFTREQFQTNHPGGDLGKHTTLT